jgi:hypothetical protein
VLYVPRSLNAAQKRGGAVKKAKIASTNEIEAGTDEFER